MLNKEDLKYIKNEINKTFTAISRALEKTSDFDKAWQMCLKHTKAGRAFTGCSYQLTIQEEARLAFLWRFRDYTAEGKTLGAEDFLYRADYSYAVYALIYHHKKELDGITVADMLYDLSPEKYRID